MRRPFPPELLEIRPEVRRRRGIDLGPIDVTTEQGALLLECFVWADQLERIERLRRAIDTLRDDPPELVAGDYVERVSDLLEQRDDQAIPVVFQTASFGYVAEERRAELYREIESAGRRGTLAFLTSAFDPDVKDCWPLELTVWPKGETRRLVYLDFHGAWLEWLL